MTLGAACAAGPSVLVDYDWSRFGRYVDIGGAYGSFLADLMAANPRARGTLFDRAQVRAQLDSAHAPLGGPFGAATWCSHLEQWLKVSTGSRVVFPLWQDVCMQHWRASRPVAHAGPHCVHYQADS